MTDHVPIATDKVIHADAEQVAGGVLHQASLDRADESSYGSPSTWSNMFRVVGKRRCP
jgi:hypothetical protein